MTFEQIIFYLFAAILVFAALCVVTVRNPVHAALFLVLAFFTSAAIWIMLEAEFLGIVLVLVYVGAVMVLFLFVVMMLNINIEPLRAGFMRYLPLGLMVAVVILIEMSVVINMNFGLEQMPVPARQDATYGNTEAIGRVLYTDYLYSFEIAAVILLVAIVAAIMLTMQKRKQTRFQNPSEQVKVRKQDRLRIVKMNAEKK